MLPTRSPSSTSFSILKSGSAYQLHDQTHGFHECCCGSIRGAPRRRIPIAVLNEQGVDTPLQLEEAHLAPKGSCAALGKLISFLALE